MLLRSRLGAFVLILTLAACTARPAVLPTATARPIASATRPVPTSTATPLPKPSSTPQSLQNTGMVPIVLPVPHALSGPAPWLMVPCAGPQPNGVPTIANGDGTGCAPVTLPTQIPADRAWYASAAPHGSYAAFRVYIRPKGASPAPNAAYQLQPNGLDDQIWIVKLPENRIIRKITQIDADGWARIQNESENSSGAPDFVPLSLGVILDPGSYQWSPDGRFLAYTGVDASGVDLFVYDSLRDVVRRMTYGHQGAFFWSWSPDRSWILYNDMTRCQLKTRCQFERGPNYFAVSFSTKEYQFVNSVPTSTVDWISKDHFLLKDTPQPGQLSTRLVQVNLADGTVAVLYDQPFLSYTYIPNTYITKSEMYLLNLSANPDSDRAAGIYILFPFQLKDRLKPYNIEKYADYTIQWQRTLERFILSKNASSGDASQKAFIYNSINMLEPVPLDISGAATLHSSPDGRWFTAQLQSGPWALFNAQGQQVQELGPGLPGQMNPVTWFKDSSAFFFTAGGQNCASPDGCMYRYDKDQDWKKVLVGELKGAPDNLQVIEP